MVVIQALFIPIQQIKAVEIKCGSALWIPTGLCFGLATVYSNRVQRDQRCTYTLFYNVLTNNLLRAQKVYVGLIRGYSSCCSVAISHVILKVYYHAHVLFFLVLNALKVSTEITQ